MENGNRNARELDARDEAALKLDRQGMLTRSHACAILGAFMAPRFDGRDVAWWLATLLAEAERDRVTGAAVELSPWLVFGGRVAEAPWLASRGPRATVWWGFLDGLPYLGLRPGLSSAERRRAMRWAVCAARREPAWAPARRAGKVAP